METLIAVLGVIPTVIGVLAVIGAPILLYYGRSLFAERGAAISPMELEKKISRLMELRDKKLEAVEHGIKDAVNSSIGRVEVAAIQRHSQIAEDLREMKDMVKDSMRRSERAVDMAKDAQHKADLATAKVDSSRELVVARLDHIERAVNALTRHRGDHHE